MRNSNNRLYKLKQTEIVPHQHLVNDSQIFAQ